MHSERSTASLHAFEEQLRADLAGHAIVHGDDAEGIGGRRVTIHPFDPRAMSIAWLETPAHIVLEAGYVGTWHMAHAPEAVERVRAIVNAIVDGRVTETAGFRRRDLTVTLDDGRVDGTVAYFGLLTAIVPLPGWRRLGRTVSYPPYR